MTMPETLAAYVAVFLAAATPWLEVLLVIPPAVAAGLDPVAVGVVAFTGNALPVAAIIVGSDRLTTWWGRRRTARGKAVPRRSRRGARAQRIADRYGVPGLAVAGPIVTGVHLAAALAVAIQGSRPRVLGWMVGSLAVWTVAITAASVAGVDRLLPGR